MCKLSLISPPDQKIKLHDDILDLLFKHKNEISRKFSDIRGIYKIDHIAINIINPSNEISIFSITPSVEYNLIIHDLWKFDSSFYPNTYVDGSLFYWEQAYKTEYFSELKCLKENKHDFSLGFNLVRKIEQHTLVYSFATRSREEKLKTYYKNMTSQLFQIGDYGYKLIRDIYTQYSNIYIPPFIETNQQIFKEKPIIKLLIDNTK